MNIKFYLNKSPENVINKEIVQLTSAVDCNKVVYGTGNMIVTVMDSYVKYNGANYAYISESGNNTDGYYYISSKTDRLGGMQEVYLVKDYLMSHSDLILNHSYCTVTDTLVGDPYIENGSFISEVKEEIQQIDFQNGFLDKGEFILIVSGGN